MPKEENNKPDYGEKLLSWQFPEFNQYERSKTWYITMAIIIVLLLIYALVSGNFLFTLVIIMITLVAIMMQRNAKEVLFTIYEDGVMFGQQYFDFKDIASFYIIYEPPEVKSLYFEFKSIWHPRAPVNLMDQDPVKVRELLLRYLTEDLEKENEPISDQFGRWLKL